MVESIVGLHSVAEALRARRRELLRLCVRKPSHGLRPALGALVEAARETGVPVIELAAGEFDARAPRGLPHQGVLLEAGPLPTWSIQQMADVLAEAHWLIALDGIEDPQNLGAIVRVAVAAGVDAALLPKRRRAALGPGAHRASAGALEHLPLVLVPNLSQALERLKSMGFWIHGADPAGEMDLFRASSDLFEERRILVLGAEDRGIRPGLKSHIDRFFRIPMTAEIGSLNVSAAAAVFLFEWRRRQRMQSSSPPG